MEQDAPSVAIYGGTFDPIHTNHVSAIRRLLKKYRTVVLATGDRNPFKSWAPSPLEDRLAMVELVLRAEGIPLCSDPHEPGVFISRIVYWYAYRFIEQWREQFPDLPFAWALGSDIAHEVSGWKNWMELNAVQPIPIEVLHRDDSIGSSTEVRKGILPPHPALRNYLREHKLYEGVAV